MMTPGWTTAFPGRWQRWPCLALLLAAPALAGAYDFEGWTPLLDLRLRYEEVGQVPLAPDAEALTLRARLGFETPALWDTRLLAEGNVLLPFDERYRPDTATLYRSQYPLVADPRDHELNRLALINSSLPGTTITLGRQRIELDDQRFVGSVGWRQNEQTYDGVRMINKSVPDLTLDASFLDRVHRAYGDDSPQGRYDGSMVLANASYGTPVGKLTGFTYLLSFDPLTHFPGLPPATAAALNPVGLSTSTWGGRFAGARPLGPVHIGYVVSWATQQQRGDNPHHFRNDYILGELSASWQWLEVKAGDEVMQGNGVVGFATPLATTHAFDGWADKFLTTPADGLDNRYVVLAGHLPNLGTVHGLTLRTIYRSFESQRTGVSYGSEWDLQLAGTWGRFKPQLAFADYRASAGTPTTVARDTHKLFLLLDYCL